MLLSLLKMCQLLYANKQELADGCIGLEQQQWCDEQMVVPLTYADLMYQADWQHLEQVQLYAALLASLAHEHQRQNASPVTEICLYGLFSHPDTIFFLREQSGRWGSVEVSTQNCFCVWDCRSTIEFMSYWKVLGNC